MVRPKDVGPRRVAVLGAGPIGLDAALAARESGFDVVVLEAAARPAANVRDWGHVRLFTPWSMNVSPRMKRAMDDAGLTLDVDEGASPTGHDLADRLLDPLWSSPLLSDVLHVESRVVALGREGVLKHEEIGAPARAKRPFRILLSGPSGREWIERADLVLDCTGKYGNFNTLGDGGIPAPGERRLADRIDARIPDLVEDGADWFGRTTLLVGSGHSAQTAARDLAEWAAGRRDTKVLWLTRSVEPDWGAVADDPLPERKQLTESARSLWDGASSVVEPLFGKRIDGLAGGGRSVTVTLRGEGGGPEAVEVDRILRLTGSVGDHSLYRQLQVHECYATSGPMKLSAALLGAGNSDCLDQENHGVETLRNPEPGFFLLGEKSYGRNNTFLLRTGWSQVDEVFAAWNVPG